MSSEDGRRKVVLLLIGVLFLFAPVLILAATIEALILLGDIEFADLSLLALLELYLLDLVLLALFALVLYRLTRYAIRVKASDIEDDTDPEAEADAENGRAGSGGGE